MAGFKNRTKNYIHLDEVINTIFIEADQQNLDIYALADRANICIKTIENLCNRITLYPRYKTIWSLANAVGLSVALMTISQRKVA